VGRGVTKTDLYPFKKNKEKEFLTRAFSTLQGGKGATEGLTRITLKRRSEKNLN